MEHFGRGGRARRRSSTGARPPFSARVRSSPGPRPGVVLGCTAAVMTHLLGGDAAGEPHLRTGMGPARRDGGGQRASAGHGTPGADGGIGGRVTLLGCRWWTGWPRTAPWGDHLAFVFDGAALDEDHADRLRPRGDELSAAVFVTAAEAADRLRDRTRRRLQHGSEGTGPGISPTAHPSHDDRVARLRTSERLLSGPLDSRAARRKRLSAPFRR